MRPKAGGAERAKSAGGSSEILAALHIPTPSESLSGVLRMCAPHCDIAALLQLRGGQDTRLAFEHLWERRPDRRKNRTRPPKGRSGRGHGTVRANWTSHQRHTLVPSGTCTALNAHGERKKCRRSRMNRPGMAEHRAGEERGRRHGGQ